jgi:hypothetical protein
MDRGGEKKTQVSLIRVETDHERALEKPSAQTISERQIQRGRDE